MGIRPEEISDKDEHSIKFEVKIDLIENLGFERIIYSSSSNNEIKIKTSENIQSSTLKISFPENKLYLFDKDKNRIR